MKQETTRPWLLAGKDLSSDAPFFLSIGLLCGIAQLTSFTYFKSNWGSNLLQEHIAFDSLLLIVVVLWLLRAAAVRLGTRFPCLEALTSHLATRAVAFASVAAMTTAGFSVIVLCTGAYRYAAVFMIFCFYLIAVAEVAANPWRKETQSRLFPLAWCLIIAVPVAFLR